MMKLYLVLTFVFYLKGVRPHTYSLGSCPDVEPQSDFNMNRMSGVWYVIQKTSTASSCMTYNFTKLPEPDEYELEQVSQHFLLGLTPLHHEYHYTGHLEAPDASVPAKMRVKFPLNPASATFTVFMADYDNYAAIFTCQKLAFAHRRSATILSRARTLDKMFIDKIRTRLSSYNVDPFEMSIVSQKDCPTGNSTYNIDIDNDTFSAHSAANAVKKVGEKLGDGIEYVAGGAKKVYHRYTDKDGQERAERMNYATMDPNSEWIP